MRSSFTSMFWGILLVLIDIRIGIDLLPDPVGYFLISYGVYILLEAFPIGKKAYVTGIALGFLSIPSIVIDQNSLDDMTQPWGLYGFILHVFHLVLVFYLFQLMLAIAQTKQDDELIANTNSTMKFYLFTLLVFYISMPFAINFYGPWIDVYTLITTIAAFIVEIAFLVMLHRFRKLDDDFTRVDSEQ